VPDATHACVGSLENPTAKLTRLLCLLWLWLQCLGGDVQADVKRLIQHLYPISLRQFKKPDGGDENGALNPFLRACTASLIRHHLGMNNNIAKVLQTAAEKA